MIRERIKSYLEYKGITPYKFCKDLGFSMGFLNKKGTIHLDKCRQIAIKYPDINPLWLMTGEGNMLCAKKMKDQTPNTVIIWTQEAYCQNKFNTEALNNPYMEDIIFVDGSLPNDMAIRAVGDSMFPHIYPGDIIINREYQDNLDSLNPNHPIVLVTKDQVFIKLLQKHQDKNKINLVSYNALHQTFTLPKTAILRIYKIIQIIGKR